jgi:hypothetical protein
VTVNGKAKGGEFERVICKRLSLWITNGDKIDVFWRSAMSGGRATVSKGKVRQGGDITAVAPEGHKLTDKYYIEIKHLKNISLDSMIKDNGPLIKIWDKTLDEAAKYNKHPVLIFRKNGWPIVVCLTHDGEVDLKTGYNTFLEYYRAGSRGFHMVRFDDWMSLTCTL